jgi:outer membrane protein
MRTLRILLISLVMLAIVGLGAHAEDIKMGYVDLSRLFDEYHKTKSYDKELEAQHKEFEKNSKEKVEKIREEQGKLALLKEENKKDVEDNIEKMNAALVEYDRQLKTDLTKQRNEKIREILLEIENVVSDYAVEEGYSVILNDRVLIYGDKSFNLTEQVLEILNSTTKSE